MPETTSYKGGRVLIFASSFDADQTKFNKYNTFALLFLSWRKAHIISECFFV